MSGSCRERGAGGGGEEGHQGWARAVRALLAARVCAAAGAGQSLALFLAHRTLPHPLELSLLTLARSLAHAHPIARGSHFVGGGSDS